MELFTIQCTTCRARLKVRDESFIGAIVNCPKCHSMVQIVPPVGWQRDGAAQSAAGSGASIGPLNAADSLSLAERSAPGAPRAAAADASATASARPAPPLPGARPPSPTGSSGVPMANEKPPAAETSAAAASSPAPAAISWWDAVVGRVKTDGLMVSGGLATGVVAGAAAWWLLGGGSGPPPQVAGTTAPVRSTAKQAAPDPQDERPEPPSATAPADADQSAAAQSPDAVASETQASAGSAADAPPSSSTSDEPVAKPDTDESHDGQKVESGAAAAPVESPMPSLKLDPVEKATSPVNPFDLSAAGVAVPPSAGDPATTGEATDTEPAGDEADPPESTMLSQTEVDERMSLSLGEVEFVGVPLAQFVEFVADVTMLPISIDDRALAQSGKRRTMPVSVHLSNTTVEDAFRAALAPLGLKVELRAGRLMVTVDGAP